MARVVVIGDDIVALSFMNAAESINERLAEAGKPVAEQIADTQRTMFSQQFTSRTGDTYDSISAVPGDPEDEDDAGVLWRVGPETFYSHFLEYGTSRQPPRPFVEPAGDLHMADWYQAARDVAADI